MDDTAVDVRVLFGVLRRRWRLIVVLTVLVVAGVAAFTFSLRPLYTASTLVLVDPSRKNLLEPDANFSSSASDNARVDSEVELVRSDTVLMGVIDQLKLTENSEFSPRLGMRDQLMMYLRLGTPTLPTGQEALNRILGSLQSTIAAQRRGQTYLISVQARSGNPERAAQIANAVAETYIRVQVESKVDAALASRSALEARLGEARNNIVGADNAFDSYMDANIARIEAESGDTTIGGLRQQIEQVEAARASATSTADVLAQEIAQGDWKATTDLLASKALADLERQRTEIATQLSSAADSSPTTLDLRAQLARIEEQLSTTANGELQTLQASIADNQQQVDTLRQQVRTSVLDSNLSSEILTEFYGLQQSAQLARSQYQMLLSRVQDLDAQASLQMADSRIVSPALPPAAPSFPNTRTMLLLGAIAGLAIGIGLAFLYENFIGGFTSQLQAENVLKLPVAAAVPAQRRLRQPQMTPADQIHDAPLSAYSESIRRIRVGIDQSRRELPAPVGATVIMVTSALPGEGKTTTALALARSYAQSGKKTLLIDGDLRRPSVHKMLGMQPENGLLEALQLRVTRETTDASGKPTKSKPFSIENIVSRDPASGTVVLLGARSSADATDRVVTDEGFGRLISAARETFDVVIVDTSPLHPVVDGLHVARLVDAVVFIVRYSTTSQLDAKNALRALQSFANVPVVLALNQQEISAAGKSSRYNDYYIEAS